jgi:hypothetical protein
MVSNRTAQDISLASLRVTLQKYGIIYQSFYLKITRFSMLHANFGH